MTEPKYAGPLANKLDNIKKMKDAGYTDKDIVDTIMASGEINVKKLQKMRDSGISDEGIIHFLVTGSDLPPHDPLRAFNRGMATGVSQILGAPSDIFQYGINSIERRADKTRLFNDGSDTLVDVPLGSDTVRSGINKLAGDNFAYDSLEDLPLSDRPVAAAGEVAGGNIVLAGGIGTLAKAKTLGKVGENILKHKKSLAAAEAGSTLGAMQGAFFGEALDPGGYGRLVGELVGGFANPVGIFYRLAAQQVQNVKHLINTLTPEGRRDRAAVLLVNALNEAGEDPGAIAAALRKKGFDIGQTAGMKSGSPTILALEEKLRKLDKDFGMRYSKAIEATRLDIQALIQALSASENKELLRAAARMKTEYIDDLVDARLQIVKDAATVERGRFPEIKDVGSPSAASYKMLEDALTDVRRIEKTEYWDKVDKTVRVENASNTFEQFTKLKSERLKIPSDALPVTIREQMRRMRLLAGIHVEDVNDLVASGLSKEDAITSLRADRLKELEKGPLTTGELITFRSRLLEEARKSRGAKDWATARIYEEMADGVLSDLNNINAPGYAEAREFSKQLNDKFSRTFAGTALSVTRQGAATIRPSLLLERAFGQGGERGSIQLGELEDAVNFSNKSMMQQQEEFLRSAAIAARNNDGSFSPDKLTRFLQNNQETLNRFPELKNNLIDLRKAEAILGKSGKTWESFRMRQRAAFELVINGEDSAAAVGKVFSSITPQKDYFRLVKAARQSGKNAKGALGGLKAATLEYAFKKALNDDGTLNVLKFKNSLWGTAGTSGPSPVEMMVRHGVMTKREAVQLRKLIRSLENLDTNLKVGAQLKTAIDTEGLYDLLSRLVGARIGARLGEGGSSLLAAQRGSEFSRKLFEKVPQSKIQDVFIEAIENPEIMAMLLERTPSPKRKAEIANRIRIWLANTGLTAPEKLEKSNPPEWLTPLEEGRERSPVWNPKEMEYGI